MECTAETDADGRLLQRQIYADGEGYMFDPRDVFRGNGGGVGGRGGGLGDGTIRTADDCPAGKQGDDDALDPDRFFEREKRWVVQRRGLAVWGQGAGGKGILKIHTFRSMEK